MKRRKALKNIGLSIGSIIAMPTAISLLQSCQQEVKITPWHPVFLSADESIVLKNIVDLILPTSDDLPGAVDLNLHRFIDLYMGKTYEDRIQNETKAGFTYIMEALHISETNPVSTLEAKDYDILLAKYLRVTEEEKQKLDKNKADKSIRATLGGIRYLTVWSYKTSEEIGKNVLIYDPIPGAQIGCTDLEELTGGVAYTM